MSVSSEGCKQKEVNTILQEIANSEFNISNIILGIFTNIIRISN
jgi:hypothetical protein